MMRWLPYRVTAILRFHCILLYNVHVDVPVQALGWFPLGLGGIGYRR